jgi:hypothetical protein
VSSFESRGIAARFITDGEDSAHLVPPGASRLTDLRSSPPVRKTVGSRSEQRILRFVIPEQLTVFMQLTHCVMRCFIT